MFASNEGYFRNFQELLDRYGQGSVDESELLSGMRQVMGSLYPGYESVKFRIERHWLVIEVEFLRAAEGMGQQESAEPMKLIFGSAAKERIASAVGEIREILRSAPELGRETV